MESLLFILVPACFALDFALTRAISSILIRFDGRATIQTTQSMSFTIERGPLIVGCQYSCQRL